jgi:hypothetical protein
MTQDQAPRTDNPADPVSGDPERVADAQENPASGGTDPTDSADPNRNADTTREAAVEPTD